MRVLAYALSGLALFGYARAEESAETAETPDADSKVIKLTKENFKETLEKYKYVLVKYYAPWCGHCKAMAPAFEQAAKSLAGQEQVAIADVDATVETELAAEQEVQGYPTLKWYTKGEAKGSDYGGGREPEQIVEWITKAMQPSLQEMKDEAEVEEVKKTRGRGAAVYVFKGGEDVQKIATDTAEGMRQFGQTLYLAGSGSSLEMFRGTGEAVKYEGVFEMEAVKAWAMEERAPFFGQISEDNFEIYVEKAKSGLFWVCMDPVKLDEQIKEYSPVFVEAAKKNETGFPFVWLDVGEFESHAKEELGCTDFPTIVLQRGDLLGDREDTKIEKFVRSFAQTPDQLNVEAVSTFFADIESGALQPVPEPDELEGLDDDETEAEEPEGEEEPKDEKEEL